MRAIMSIELYTSGTYETLSANTPNGIGDRQLVEPAGDPAARLQAVTWLLGNMREIHGLPTAVDAATLLATLDTADDVSQMDGVTIRRTMIEIS